MWAVTKMLTEHWIEAVQAEGFAGRLSRYAAWGNLPAGVNADDPRTLDALRRCCENFRGHPHNPFLVDDLSQHRLGA